MLTRSIGISSQCWMQHSEMEIGQEVVDACLIKNWSLQSFYTSSPYAKPIPAPRIWGCRGGVGKGTGVGHCTGHPTVRNRGDKELKNQDIW